MGWKEHNDEKKFVLKLQTQRGYEYSYRWYEDLDGLPNNEGVPSGVDHILGNKSTALFSYVEENKDIFYYNLYNKPVVNATPKIKYENLNINNTTILNNIYKDVLSKIKSATARDEISSRNSYYSRPIENADVSYSAVQNILASDIQLSQFGYEYQKFMTYYNADNDPLWNYDHLDDAERSKSNYYGSDYYSTYSYYNYPTLGANKYYSGYAKTFIISYVVEEVEYPNGTIADEENYYTDFDSYGRRCRKYTTTKKKRIIITEEDFIKNLIKNFVQTGSIITPNTNTGLMIDISDSKNKSLYSRYGVTGNSYNAYDYVYNEIYNSNAQYYGYQYVSLNQQDGIYTLLKKNNYLYYTLQKYIVDALDKYIDDDQNSNNINLTEYEQDEDFYIKNWFYDTNVCPYANDSNQAYGDHIHGTVPQMCCHGFTMGTRDQHTGTYEYEVSWSCPNIIGYNWHYTETYIVQVEKEVSDSYGRPVYNADGSRKKIMVPETRTSTAGSGQYYYMTGSTVPKSTGASHGGSISGPFISYIRCGTPPDTPKNKFYKGDGYSDYDSSSPVYHTTEDIQGGRCAGYTGVMSGNMSAVTLSVDNTTYGISDFGHVVSGKIGVSGYSCKNPLCLKSYGYFTLSATYTDVYQMYIMETSNKQYNNVNECKAGYPYYRIPSCSSPYIGECDKHSFMSEGYNNSNVNHIYTGINHEASNSRVFKGHEHTAKCYKTRYMEETSISKNDSKKVDKILTEKILSATKNKSDYNYWISPWNLKDVSESVYFEKDFGYIRFNEDGIRYTFNYQDPNVTGINCKDYYEKDIKTSIRKYSGELYSKYYSIINFHLYKVSELVLHDNDITRSYIETDNGKNTIKNLEGNPIFKFAISNTFDETKRNEYNTAKTQAERNAIYDNKTVIKPNDAYNEMFTKEENSLHSPTRIVSNPIVGEGDVPGSKNPIINYDLYADNFNQDPSTIVDNRYASETFTSDRNKYIITKGNEKDYEWYNLGYSLDYLYDDKNISMLNVKYNGKNYDYEGNYGSVKLINAKTKQEVELDEDLKIAKIISSPGNRTYSLGNYDVDVLYLKVPVVQKGYLFIMTSKSALSDFINDYDGIYSFKLDESIGRRVFILTTKNKTKVDNLPESEYNTIKKYLESKTKASNSRYVSTPGLYTGAGNNGKYFDTFTRRDSIKYDRSNLFLADANFYDNINKKNEVGKAFEKIVQDSVEAMSNTESLLRVGISYEVQDFYNDYFTFTKNYGETLYADPTSEAYEANKISYEMDHHTRYENDDSLLNRNKNWGYVRYTYNFVDGMRVFIKHDAEEYSKMVNWNNAFDKAEDKEAFIKDNNNKNLLENYLYLDLKNGKLQKDSEGRIKYTNSVAGYSANNLINNHAFEDYFEYNLQGRTSNTTLYGVESDTLDDNISIMLKLGDLGKFSATMYVNYNSELNKLFDITDFVNVKNKNSEKSELETGKFKDLGDSIVKANGNNITKTEAINQLGGKIIYSYKGLDGTYFKTENPKYDESKEKDGYQSSEYTYTKNYESYTDTKANKKLIDIYDWSLKSYKTISSLTENIQNGQTKGDGVGNGVRNFTFDVKYEIVRDDEQSNNENDLFRFDNEQDGSPKGYKNVSNYTNYTEYGKVSRVNADTVYMSKANFTGSENYQKTIINDSPISTQEIENTGNKLNIINPMKLSAVNVKNLDSVSQEIESRDNDAVILGKNTNFEIEFISASSTANVGYGIDGKGIDTRKYIKEYWIKNDFDVYCSDSKCVEHGSGNPGIHLAGEVIRIKANKDENSTKYVSTTTSSYGDTAVGIGTNNTVVCAIASDVPGIDNNHNLIKGKGLLAEYLFNEFKEKDKDFKYIDKDYDDSSVGVTYNGRKTGSMNERDYSNNNPLYTYTINDAYHSVYRSFETESTYRIFSFEVTDFTDLSYKNIFRNGISGTGNYFAGKYQWDYNILNKQNQLKDLDSLLGTSNARIDRTIDKNYSNYGGGYVLPVGPNSIKDTGYVYGPKLGYTFSFDFKTTGYFDDTKENKLSNRYTTVIPSYYYISKDGKLITDVELYYKNADGKYIKFENSGYKIAFKPNDGYRNYRFTQEEGYVDSYLSTDLKYIDISNKEGFTLDKEFMTTSFNNFMQTWYGEFKLPNSTIVVEKGKTPNDALKNGYIGVCFEILCTDKGYKGTNKDSLVVSYNQNDKGNITKYIDENDPTRNYVDNNTSQWDYDGMFGIDTVGRTGDITLKNGWKVTNEQWQKIKSTVVLYETDLRADDDFN